MSLTETAEIAAVRAVLNIAVVRAVLNEDHDDARERLKGFNQKELGDLVDVCDAVIDLATDQMTANLRARKS